MKVSLSFVLGTLSLVLGVYYLSIPELKWPTDHYNGQRTKLKEQSSKDKAQRTKLKELSSLILSAAASYPNLSVGSSDGYC